MAVGAGGNYGAEQRVPSVLKHSLLGRYVPPFAAMTGSKSGKRVVYLDGYAGQGRYDNGDPGSAERIMMIAKDQQEKVALTWTCFFVEADRGRAEKLAAVVDEYTAHGVAAQSHHGSVNDVLPNVVQTAVDLPLFLFLDPCGLGLPFADLTALLTGLRAPAWPPTEFMLNFSLEAVRRIAGHLDNPKGNETTLKRLDDSLGGDWWRGHVQGRDLDEAVEAVSAGYASRLRDATSMSIVTVPVRRAPHHKPIYNLVFGTRSPHGLWVFGDAAARATEDWWDTLEEVEAKAQPDTLFGITETIRPKLEMVEHEAVSNIASNLEALLVRYPSGYKVVDHPAEVFGDYYGQVRDPVVRKAVKELHARHGSASNGSGGKPRELVVLPPQTGS